TSPVDFATDAVPMAMEFFPTAFAPLTMVVPSKEAPPIAMEASPGAFAPKPVMKAALPTAIDAMPPATGPSSKLPAPTAIEMSPVAWGPLPKPAKLPPTAVAPDPVAVAPAPHAVLARLPPVVCPTDSVGTNAPALSVPQTAPCANATSIGVVVDTAMSASALAANAAL